MKTKTADTDQTTTDQTTTPELTTAPSGFRAEMSGREPETETTTSTTTPPPDTDQTTTDQTTTPAPADPPVRRAKGYEDVPELVDGLKNAAKSLTDAAASMTQKPASKPDATTDDFKYNEEEVEQLSVLEEMESLYPDKYKGIVDNAKKLIKTIEGQEAKILNENPDISDEDLSEKLAEYRDSLGVKWSDSDFRKAEIQREIKPLKAEKEKLEKKVGQLDEEDRQAKIAPVAKERAGKVVAETVVAGLGDEFKSLVDASGAISAEEKDKLVADDPLIADIAIDAIESTRLMSEAAVLVFSGGKSPLVGDVVAWAKHAESTIAALPKEKQLNKDGKQFVPRAVFNRLTEDQRKNVWVVGADDIIPMFTNQFVSTAKSHIDKIKARDQKKYPAPKPESKKVEKPVSPTSVNTVIPPAVEPVAKNFFTEMKKGTA